MRNTYKMKRATLAFILILAVIAFPSCVEFKTISLYDGIEPPVKPEKPATLRSVVEPVIYEDLTKDMWGLETDVCKSISITNKVVHRGTQAISLKWNRNAPGCDWAGIGFGWDSYAGKDLIPIIDYAAIEMYVRTKEGKMFGLPIVLTLEDYSGGMGFSYTGNKYFERTAIDEEWQKVVVPLNSFDMEKENLDPSNIKSLNLELQQSGDIYIDDISLVFYEPEEVEPWMIEEELPDPSRAPITIFDDSFINENSTGFMSYACQEVSLVKDAQRGSVIRAKWEMEEYCDEIGFGASWNKWHPVDLTGVMNARAIQFDVKLASGSAEELPLYVSFVDYDRVRSKQKLLSKYVEGGVYDNQWRTVTVPISDLPSIYDPTRIKYMGFTFENSGELFVDNIRIVEI
jgi:hypothetical protein